MTTSGYIVLFPVFVKVKSCLCMFAWRESSCIFKSLVYSFMEILVMKTSLWTFSSFCQLKKLLTVLVGKYGKRLDEQYRLSHEVTTDRLRYTLAY